MLSCAVEPQSMRTYWVMYGFEMRQRLADAFNCPNRIAKQSNAESFKLVSLYY